MPRSIYVNELSHDSVFFCRPWPWESKKRFSGLLNNSSSTFVYLAQIMAEKARQAKTFKSVIHTIRKTCQHSREEAEVTLLFHYLSFFYFLFFFCPFLPYFQLASNVLSWPKPAKYFGYHNLGTFKRDQNTGNFLIRSTVKCEKKSETFKYTHCKTSLSEFSLFLCWSNSMTRANAQIDFGKYGMDFTLKLTILTISESPDK